MKYVATVIGSLHMPLNDALIAEAATLTGDATPDTLAHAEAVDFRFDAPSATAIGDALDLWAISKNIDVIVQPAANRRKKALLADMESTLIHQEMLDELAGYVGLTDKIKEITQRAMNGELDFRAALAARLELLRGIKTEVIDELLARMTYMEGARDLVATMRGHGAECVLVSGGFTCFTNVVAEHLGFHHNFGNVLGVENGALTGRVVEPVLDKTSKLEALQATAQRLGIAAADICAVGDGANDVPMLKAAGLGIAFHGKPAVQGMVAHNVRFAGLRALLWAQGYRAVDIKN